MGNDVSEFGGLT